MATAKRCVDSFAALGEVVVNGFDGALTMLGLIMGFYVSDRVDLAVVITSCLAAALALGMSRISSAYISEAAERRRDLAQLEKAMGTSLNESHHARAATWIPWLVALVNGIAPLLIALIIIVPLPIQKTQMAERQKSRQVVAITW